MKKYTAEIIRLLQELEELRGEPIDLDEILAQCQSSPEFVS